MEIYFCTVIYFALLYFVVGRVFLKCCLALEKGGCLSKIVMVAPLKDRKRREQQNSLASVMVFGISGILLVLLIRNHLAELKPDTYLNVTAGVFILNLWNEVYFFLIHKMLHQPFFYRSIHKTHHQSKVPSVFSVYSFHPIEALLLSAVPLTIAPFVNLSSYAYLLYPLTSVLLNYAGHCNYRFGNGNGNSLAHFGSRHAAHHFKNTAKFGFVTGFIDHLTAQKPRT